MAMQLGELVWKITGDKSGFDKSISQSEKKAKGLGSTWKSVGKTIAVALAGIGLGKLVKSLIKAGSEAEEVGQKFGVVFKGITKEANSVAANLAANYGLARTEAKKLLSNTGDLLTGFGLTNKEALNLSKQVQELAVDLTSFSNVNGGVKFSSEALTKGLFGETEQMKSLGIVINQNSEEFKAQVKQYQEVEGKTLLQAKAMTILSMATEQSKNAIGDFERSMSSYANQTRIAESNIANLQETLGSKLLPLAGLAVKAFNGVIVQLDKMAQSMGEFISSAEGAEKISDIIGTIAGSFAAAWVIIQPILSALKESFNLIVDAVKDIIGPVEDGSDAFFFFSTVTNVVGKSLKAVVTVLVAAIKTLVNFAKVIFTSGKTIASFFLALAGKGSWDTFNKNVDNSKATMLKFGSDLKQGYKDVGGAIVDIGKAFGEDATSTATKAMTAYKNAHDNFKSATKNALLAQQQKTTADDAEIKRNRAATKSMKERTEAMREFGDALKTISSGYASSLGQVEELFSSIGELSQAIGEGRIAELDKQMEKELEAAGLLEDSKEEQLLSEISRAEKLGDIETATEKKKALERLKIEQKYAKKKAMIEYEVAKMQWGFQLAMAIAQLPLMIMQGMSSGWAIPIIGAVMGPLYGAIAGAAGVVQIASVAAAKPKPPSFQTGGVVSGNQAAGDAIAAQVNSGEMILNSAQQARLFNIADGRGQGSTGNIAIYIGDELIYDNLYDATKNGDLLIDARAVTDI